MAIDLTSLAVFSLEPETRGQILFKKVSSNLLLKLLAQLMRSAELIRCLARFLAWSQPHGKEINIYQVDVSISSSLNLLCTVPTFRVCLVTDVVSQSRGNRFLTT